MYWSAITGIIEEFDSTLLCGSSSDNLISKSSVELLETTTKEEEFDSLIFLNEKEENFEKLNKIIKKNPKIEIFSCKNLKLIENYKKYLKTKNENSNLNFRILDDNLLIEILIKQRIKEINSNKELEKIYFISDFEKLKIQERKDNIINVVINENSIFKDLRSFMMSLISLSSEEEKFLSQK